MHRQVLQFVIAGVVGFVVDAGILYLTLALGLGYFAGRAVSFLCAVWATWQINRRYTFAAARTESAWVEWWRYLAAMSVGGVVNYCAYSATVLTLKGIPFLPVVAVAVGSLAGMVVNFASAKLWVFKQR
ncbi:GtrA family protein [Paraburkholderia phenazinium]|jgi:putative flippase GtrA|uniref:Putative flippase GtrA (Transmembrane translocase of bactoprenol-linked glucose) n=1 Tax=Paraburkholderia phenazinium TaxID=60549 RepID=A0A1G8E1W0_9BURK|nr:GtrA family protein [Paraburkholderia phenazinium]SDH63942.1 Putative flippase GtrA (transmembrane translocase of bactoprenol-linked glucose) [Paraburkholderia phenazinium]